MVEDCETSMIAGDAAGWKAGEPTAHCLENRSDADAVILVVGTRHEADIVHYPDHGFTFQRDPSGKTFIKSDGTSIVVET